VAGARSGGLLWILKGRSATPASYETSETRARFYDSLSNVRAVQDSPKTDDKAGGHDDLTILHTNLHGELQVFPLSY
jgi:hypothetical protein